MWRTISYVSTVDKKLTDLELKELFNFVRAKNNKLKVTGILLYSDGNFFQVLEGESTLIEDLYRTIKLDSRHYDIITIFNHKMNEFSFSEYHSSFTTIHKQSNHGELHNFLEKEKSNNPENFNRISYLINQFMQIS